MNRHHEGLSCYTANLANYLSAEWDAAARLGESVRLAVRSDLPDGLLAFSHHDVALNELPDGTRLEYASAPTPAVALDGLAAELDKYGRVLAVVDNTRLPWSPCHGRARPAPHWLLVDERAGDTWHVVDEFTALMPEGEQRPFAGRLCTAALREAMMPSRWTPAQEERNRLAFGFPVRLPDNGRVRWLRRKPGGPTAARLTGRWLTGDAHVLPFLADYFADRGAQAATHLDDIWAAAGHRRYAYRWRLGADGVESPAALNGWARLPAILRLAVASAQRGRPRPALIHKAIDELRTTASDLRTPEAVS